MRKVLLSIALCLLVAFIAYAGSYEGNAKKLATDFPDQYNSWHGSLKSSEEPDRNLPANPAQMIIFGNYYNYRDVVAGKRAHTNSMLEAYWSVGGDGSYMQRCLPCHSSDAPGLMAKYGEDDFYQGKFDVLTEGVNPIGCANCHDTETMELRVGNPFAVRAIEKLGKDPQKLSQNELRSYVCAQCHYEYVSPVKNGVKTVEMDWSLYGDLEKLSKYYDTEAAVSYTHPLSKAPLVKPMNNEAGLAMNGIHYKHGVACADCHMPQVTVKGTTFTSHDNVAGSRNIQAACQPCHEDIDLKTLQNEVDTRLAEYNGPNAKKLEKSLAETHLLIAQALKAGAKENQLKGIYQNMRSAQWRWDYLMWQKGGSFHAPYETQKLLATALTQVGDAKTDTLLLLSQLGVKNVQIPDFSTVQNAAKILGLDYPQKKGSPADDTYMKQHLKEALDKGLINEDIYHYEMKKLF